MRNVVFLFVPALIAAAAIACEGDPDPSGNTVDLDGGTIDVSRPDVVTQLPDAAEDAPAPNGVTVTVVTRQGPKAGTRVLAHDATGAVTESKTTGPDGKATFTGATPSMLTALLADEVGSERSLFTWTGVENGDDLVVEAPLRSFDAIGQLNVGLTNGAPSGATYFYAKVGDCSNGQSTLPVPVGISASCAPPAAGHNVLFVAEGPGVGEKRHSFVKNVTLPTDGGTLDLNLADPAASIDFSVNATNATDLFATAHLHEIAGIDSVINDSDPGDLYASGNDPRTAVYKRSATYADALLAYADTYSDGSSSILMEKIAAAGATAKTFDFATRLPVITAATANVVNPRRPVITWTAASPLAAAGAKGGAVDLEFLLDGEEVYRHWTIVVPPTATSVTAPVLPEDAAEWMPAGDAAGIAYFDPDVVFADGSGLASYALVRRGAGVVLALKDFAYQRFVAVPNGATFRMTRYRFSNPR